MDGTSCGFYAIVGIMERLTANPANFGQPRLKDYALLAMKLRSHISNFFAQFASKKEVPTEVFIDFSTAKWRQLVAEVAEGLTTTIVPSTSSPSLESPSSLGSPSPAAPALKRPLEDDFYEDDYPGNDSHHGQVPLKPTDNPIVSRSNKQQKVGDGKKIPAKSYAKFYEIFARRTVTAGKR